MKQTATETESKTTKKSPRRAEKAAKRLEGAKKKPVKQAETTGPGTWPAMARQFLTEVVYELKKVVWPSRKETMASTSVVIVVVLIVGAFLGVVDVILSRVMRLVVG